MQHLKNTVLLTGGCGYIGSHSTVELLQAGYEVVIVDNLVNASPKVLDRIEALCGKRPLFYPFDIGDRARLEQVFAQHPITAVLHFAALKAVGESVQKPLNYYQNNVSGSLVLFEVMAQHQVRTIVFSSSATVYGNPSRSPITEDFPLKPESPYGWSKLMIEQMLRDLERSDVGWSVALLRYFNPVGAHPSGQIGEDPHGIPNNLMPYIAQVAVGKLPHLNVFGADYPTRDGTGVRDYIHVVDLARGHVRALHYLQSQPGLVTLNLGTGHGCSVLEVLHAFERASGQRIAYQTQPRRAGDVPEYFADPGLARRLLGWHAELDLDAMCRDSWNWQSHNPGG